MKKTIVILCCLLVALNSYSLELTDKERKVLLEHVDSLLEDYNTEELREIYHLYKEEKLKSMKPHLSKTGAVGFYTSFVGCRVAGLALLFQPDPQLVVDKIEKNYPYDSVKNSTLIYRYGEESTDQFVIKNKQSYDQMLHNIRWTINNNNSKIMNPAMTACFVGWLIPF